MQYDRLKLLIGDKFEKLRNKTVLIVGVGGVGGYALESIVRSGVNNIIIVDNDRVDITNLNRQIISLHSNIGELKVEVDEMFRSMVYEELKKSFVDDTAFYEADLTKLVAKTKKEKGMYICFLYLAAMIRVGYVESHRLDKLLANNKG